MPTVSEISRIIETYAPLRLQENYDNSGLQIGLSSQQVTAVLLCLDVTDTILDEAIERGCNLIISHHPLLFGGLKNVTDGSQRGRIIIKALKHGIAIYSAHTNLDRADQGVSMELALAIGLKDVKVLAQDTEDERIGLGAIGLIEPMPTLEFLRKVKEIFKVKCLRYSACFNSLTVRKVAVCGGAGSGLIDEAVRLGADSIVTGDVKYHDFTTWGRNILLVDAGHYESELCTRKIFSNLLADNFPSLPTYISESESNPINIL